MNRPVLKQSLPPEAQFKLARAWHAKGTVARAIQGYRDVLEQLPEHLDAALCLLTLLEEHQRPHEALAVCTAALRLHPNEARLHKRFVELTLSLDGPQAVFDHYRLTRSDARLIHLRPSEPVCCVVLRNEVQRLPYFLDYYRRHGIRAFFAVDNGSTDGSIDYLRSQPDVWLWQSDLSFNSANFGAGWFEPILRTYARGHWALIVDADELFCYPDCEHLSIPELCRSLDRRGKRAWNAVLLDMYSDRAIRDTVYTAGTPFEETCPWFDRQFFHDTYEHGGPFRNQTVLFGGARQRVFGKAGEYYISKVPLLKYDTDCILAGGQHWTNLPANLIASGRGCLLHFKYFASFETYVREEARRAEHYGSAMQYQEYQRGLDGNEALTLFHSDHSVRFESSEQLQQLGIIEPFTAETNAPTPRIEPVTVGTPRPFWSVMLTVWRRTRFLAEALGSVLRQAPDPARMQIEVVCDGPREAVHSEIEAIVRQVGSDRVGLYVHPVNAGHPEIFNVALRRAQGHWIHILHDDDRVRDGFYRHLEAGMAAAPDVGAAFTRQTYIDEAGKENRKSFLERESPGVIEDWWQRIAHFCRLQTPSIVVSRAAYERVGGYRPAAASVFDWDMWLRLAMHYPVWYDPEPLASFRESNAQESSGLIATGRQIQDTRLLIDRMQSEFPARMTDALAARARAHYAHAAVQIAQASLDKGDATAALANIREALLCSESTDILREAASLLRRKA